MRYIKNIFALITGFAVLTMLSLTSYAQSGGISVSSSSLQRGQSFTVTLSVPKTENADTAFVKVEFDADAFEVVTWKPTVPGCEIVYNSGSGFFAFTYASAYRNMDLSGGLSLSAVLNVKKSAALGTYSIRLTNSDLTYVKENGYETEALWKPSVNVRYAKTWMLRRRGCTTTQKEKAGFPLLCRL